MLQGEGKIERTAAGKLAITLPDTDDLDPFLATLADRARALLPAE